MAEQLFDRKLNYALILLSLALLVYSSIGFAIEQLPVQADAQPTIDGSSPDAQMQASGVAMPLVLPNSVSSDPQSIASK